MVNKNSNEIINRKCAPSKKYIDGSCLSEQSIRKIVKAYNNKNKDRIDISLPKKALLDKLNEKLSDQCSHQVCWLRLEFIKELYDNDINNSFRPEGPPKKYDWLSTININEVLEQYQEVHSEFLFLGAVPYDFEDLPILGLNKLNFKELEENHKTKLGLVINLDEHYKSGSHWVSLYFDLKKYQIYYFDSVGKQPRKRIKKFITKVVKYLYKKMYNENISINKLLKNKILKNNKQNILNKYLKNIQKIDINYNSVQHQTEDSECGVYSTNFIIRLLEGETFSDISNNIIKDEDMNKNRKLYFYNVI